MAIITRGASGFGKTMAKRFIQHGAKVIKADVQDDLGQVFCKEFDSVAMLLVIRTLKTLLILPCPSLAS